MINKTPSAKAHLVKFLLAVPLVAVLLVAFRNGASKPGAGKENIGTAPGLVLDALTQAPIAGVMLHETYSNVSATTDARGFYSIAISNKQQPPQAEIGFRKNGHKSLHSNALITTKKQETATGTVEIMGTLKSKEAQQKYGVNGPGLEIVSKDRPQKNTLLKSPATMQAPADTTPYERKLQYLKEEIAHLKDSVQNNQHNEKVETEKLLLQKELAAIQQKQSEMQNDKIKNQAAIQIQQDKAEHINIELKKEAHEEQKKEVQLHEQKKQEIYNQQQKVLELHAQKEQKKNIELQKAQKIRLQKKQEAQQKKQPTEQN